MTDQRLATSAHTRTHAEDPRKSSLTPEQIAIVEAHRDDGERLVVAARAAGISTWVLSKYCTQIGRPWPRGSERRAIHKVGPIPATREEALAMSERELIEMTRSTSPAMREFAKRSLQDLRDHGVTSTPPISSVGRPSGDVVRRSGGSDA